MQSSLSSTAGDKSIKHQRSLSSTESDSPSKKPHVDDDTFTHVPKTSMWVSSYYDPDTPKGIRTKITAVQPTEWHQVNHFAAEWEAHFAEVVETGVARSVLRSATDAATDDEGRRTLLEALDRRVANSFNSLSNNQFFSCVRCKASTTSGDNAGPVKIEASENRNKVGASSSPAPMMVTPRPTPTTWYADIRAANWWQEENEQEADDEWRGEVDRYLAEERVRQIASTVAAAHVYEQSVFRPLVGEIWRATAERINEREGQCTYFVAPWGNP